jgi:replicative DNA helicase
MSAIKPEDRPFGFKYHWEVIQKSIKNIDDRRKGRIKSFVTPWDSINNATAGGIEWGSVVTIGARPGAGKTMFVSNLLRDCKALNPTQDFNILEFQLEMTNEQYGQREIVAATGLDYNQVLSTKQQLEDFNFERIQQYGTDCKRLHDHGVFRGQINKSITATELEKAVHHYYNTLGGKPLIVTIDHSWLIKKDTNEREKLQTLYNTADVLIQLKQDLPVIIIMLTQLNRNIEDPLRKAPGSIQNYPTSGDIFGGDAMMQASDVVMALSRPFTFDITAYGPKSFAVTEDSIFLHLLKVRNGANNTKLIFMQGLFGQQKIIETVSPGYNIQPGYVPRNANRRPSADIGNEL